MIRMGRQQSGIRIANSDYLQVRSFELEYFGYRYVSMIKSQKQCPTVFLPDRFVCCMSLMLWLLVYWYIYQKKDLELNWFDKYIIIFFKVSFLSFQSPLTSCDKNLSQFHVCIINIATYLKKVLASPRSLGIHF